MLPLLGIVVLMVLGFAILMTALTYDPTLKPVRSRDRASTGQRRRQWNRRGQARRAFYIGRTAVQESAVIVRGEAQHSLSALRIAVRELTRAVHVGARARLDEWWPRVRDQATDAQGRWLTLESATLPLLVIAAASVVLAYLIVAFG
jgi:hypothetical protein